MRNLIVTGCVITLTALLYVTTADGLSTELSHETPPIASGSSPSSATLLGPSSEDMADDTGPSHVASSSSSSKVASADEDPLRPTAPGISEESAGTSSLVLGVIRANPDDSEAGYSQRDVVVIAVCVSLLSLVVVVLSVAMTFLIRRRLRQKAYLRVKHASQTELSVHYVQNTPASAAARDLVMGQLFESLASMDADVANGEFQIAHNSDDRYLSPSDSVDTELAGGGGTGGAGTNRMYSRSMPSLKNLNAHEEALNCNFPFVVSDAAASGKRKTRSRSFTEKTVSGVGVVDAAAARGKGNAVRSHSEKSKNRLAVGSILSPGKRFEKKKDKAGVGAGSNRRSTPSFSRFARFNILRGSAGIGQSSKQRAAAAKEPLTNGNVQTIEAEQTPLTEVTVESPDASTITADASDLARSKHYSTSLSDFELPHVSSIVREMRPMFAALQTTNSSDSAAQDITIDDVKIFREVPLSNHHEHRLSSCSDKAASLEQVTGEHFRKRAAAPPGPGKPLLLSARQTKPAQTSRSVNDLDAMRTTVV